VDDSDMFTQEPMFTQDDGLVELVILPCRWGAIAVDAAWYDRFVIRNPDWRVPWKALLARAEAEADLWKGQEVTCEVVGWHDEVL